MAWPIPELPPSEPPKPIDWRIWSLIFLAVLGLGSAVVVILWPQGRATHTAMFGMLAVGVPLCFFAILFGVKLNDWEQRQLEHEERVRENQRLKLLWHSWANRCVHIANATCLLGGVESTDDWEKPGHALPINLDRTRALEWLETIEAEKRRETIVSLIADRFSKQLSTLRSMNVLLLLDETSAGDKVQWNEAVHNALSTYRIRLSVECRTASGDLSVLSSYVDQCNMPTTLIIAGQFWRVGVPPCYSEGVAAILLHATPPVARPHDDNRVEGCRFLRPMFSTAREIGADLQQVANLQFSSNSIKRAWLGALDRDAAPALRLEMGKCSPTKEATINDMDEVLGIPGPASSWLTLSIAVEMGLRSRKPQLAAIYDSTSKHAVLCTLLPELVKDQST
ncbi:hypothetical protein DP57_6105 [Burkholderia pseudomallei]|nr:hypothetical protein DP57_6105 [Burkholderia pseudomallei]